MALIDDIEETYAQREMREVKVPEWGVTFCVWPLTIKQLSLIQSVDDQFMRALKIIQIRGKTPSGLQTLDHATVDKLAQRGVGKFGPAVIARVAMEIMADVPTAEAVEKN